VPSAALRYRPANVKADADASGPRGRSAHADRPRRRTVWVLRAGQPVAVPVRTGLSDGSTVEIVEGDLHPGDSIILGDGSTPAAATDPSGQTRPGGNRRNGGGPRRPPSIL
jgi:HlyD family secretion protein